MWELTDKVCVITGGAGGLGAAMGRRFLDAGMQVVLGDMDATALDRMVDELGEPVAGVVCDVTDPASMEALRDTTLERFGGVHLVCLNAGVAPISLLTETDEETWRWVIDVNVLGVVHGVRTFAPGLVAQGYGHIVCTASLAGLSSTYAMGAYSASKHAVVGLAATLAEELRPAGVAVSIVCPGPFRTRIFDSEHNRPASVAGASHAVETEVVDLYRASVDASPDPAEFADAVHDGVIGDDLFILPSPELEPMVEERFAAIGAAFASGSLDMDSVARDTAQPGPGTESR